jgi:hypothetical protein
MVKSVWKLKTYWIIFFHNFAHLLFWSKSNALIAVELQYSRLKGALKNSVEISRMTLDQTAHEGMTNQNNKNVFLIL